MHPAGVAGMLFVTSMILLGDTVVPAAQTDWPGILMGVAAILGALTSMLALILTQRKHDRDDDS